MKHKARKKAFHGLSTWLEGPPSGEEGSATSVPFIGWLMRWARMVFGGDRRSIALFRVALGLTVLGDLIDRWWDLRAHYSDEGFFSRKVAVEYFTDLTWICVHMMSGKVWVMHILFLLHALLACCLLIGYRCKISAVAVWFLTNSLHCRNVLVLHSGDVYLRLCLFWALFLPLDSCWSVDKALAESNPSRVNQRNQRPSYSVICGGTFAMAVQVTVMYVSSVYHKSAREWTVDGTATFYALSLDYFRMPLGDLYLYLHPTILSYLTLVVLYWEWLGCFLFFSPWNTGPVRTVAVIGYIFMHLNFALSMRLGTFFYVCVTGVVVLLPSWFWEELVFSPWLLLRDPHWKRMDIYYISKRREGTRFYEIFCRLVGHMFLLPGTSVKPIEHLRPYHTELLDEEEQAAAAGSGRSRVGKEFYEASIVAIDHAGKPYKDYQAIIAICRASPLLWPMVSVLKYITASGALLTAARAFGTVIKIVKELFILCLYGEEGSSYLFHCSYKPE